MWADSGWQKATKFEMLNRAGYRKSFFQSWQIFTAFLQVRSFHLTYRCQIWPDKTAWGVAGFMMVEMRADSGWQATQAGRQWPTGLICVPHMFADTVWLRAAKFGTTASQREGKILTWRESWDSNVTPGCDCSVLVEFCTNMCPSSWYNVYLVMSLMVAALSLGQLEKWPLKQYGMVY